MKRKNLIKLSGCLFGVAAAVTAGVVGANMIWNDNPMVAEANNEYSMSFDSGKPITFSGGVATVQTNSGWNIGLSGTNVDNPTGAAFGFSAAGKVYNTTAITGIQTITMVVSGADRASNYTISYGYSDLGTGTAYDSEVVASDSADSQTITVNIAGATMSYFSIETDNGVTSVDSLVIDYSCDPAGSTNVDIFEYDGTEIPYNGEAALGAGGFCYWAGEGGSVSSATYDASTSTIKMDYTNGNKTWAIQLFYKIPYLGVESTYRLTGAITATASGSITINGSAIALTANEAYNLDLSYKTKETVLSVQLANGTSFLPSGSITISNFSIVDVDNTYYDISFVDSDGTAIDHVNAMAGHALWRVPNDPTPAEGYTFDGWALSNGTKIGAASSYVPTDDVVLKATYAAANLTVSYVVNGATIQSIATYSGATLTAPTLGYDECGFGYSVAGWYKDEAYVTAWNFDTDTVSESMSLYAKLQITPSELYGVDVAGTNDDEGAYNYAGTGFTGDTWGRQINFAPVPNGTSGTSYNITITYKASSAFSVKIYDNEYTVQGYLSIATEWTTITLTYTGGGLSSACKLTFELGNIDAGNAISLSIGKIEIAAAV